MKKSLKNRIEKVKNLLYKQKIRNLSQLEDYKLSVCHPHSAGIDIGSREIYVAVNPEISAGLDEPVVRTFGTYTSALRECLEWLTFCGVEDVSMESTSVYWKNLYDILEKRGMRVYLVNPKKFRMVPGHKTDVLDRRDFKDDQLFLLRKNRETYEFFNGQMDMLDKEIEAVLLGFPSAEAGMASAEDCTVKDTVECAESVQPTEQPKKKKGRPRKNHEGSAKPGKNDLKTECDLKKELLRINGADLTAITGMGANTILQIMAEVGTDMW